MKIFEYSKEFIYIRTSFLIKNLIIYIFIIGLKIFCYKNNNRIFKIFDLQ